MSLKLLNRNIMSSRLSQISSGERHSVSNFPLLSLILALKAEVTALIFQDELMQYSDNDPATFEAMS